MYVLSIALLTERVPNGVLRALRPDETPLASRLSARSFSKKPATEQELTWRPFAI